MHQPVWESGLDDMELFSPPGTPALHYGYKINKRRLNPRFIYWHCKMVGVPNVISVSCLSFVTIRVDGAQHGACRNFLDGLSAH